MRVKTKFDVGDKVYYVVEQSVDSRVKCETCGHPTGDYKKKMEWETKLVEDEVLEVHIHTFKNGIIDIEYGLVNNFSTCVAEVSLHKSPKLAWAHYNARNKK